MSEIFSCRDLASSLPKPISTGPIGNLLTLAVNELRFDKYLSSRMARSSDYIAISLALDCGYGQLHKYQE